MPDDTFQFVVQEFVVEHDFEFLDLTLEGPAADVEQIDLATLRSILRAANMHVVGHTAWYLPFASPVARVRRGRSPP